MTYYYSYLLGTLAPLLLWLTIYWLREDLRKEMLRLSLFSAILAPLAGLLHIRDWWNPVTITHTAIGIEDALYAFAIAGIATSIYQFVTKKRFEEAIISKEQSKIQDRKTITLIAVGITLFTIISLLTNSQLGYAAMAIVITALILVQRPDLGRYSLVTGLLVTIISIPSYLLVEAVTPGWIMATWQLDNFCNHFFLGIPLEELGWHFLAGISASLMYKYWKVAKETRKKTKKKKRR